MTTLVLTRQSNLKHLQVAVAGIAARELYMKQHSAQLTKLNVGDPMPRRPHMRQVSRDEKVLRQDTRPVRSLQHK